jgi:hypothetical protein
VLAPPGRVDDDAEVPAPPEPARAESQAATGGPTSDLGSATDVALLDGVVQRNADVALATARRGGLRLALPLMLARALAPQIGNRALMRLIQRDDPPPSTAPKPAGGGGLPATPGIALNEANKKRAEKIIGDAYGQRKAIKGTAVFLEDAPLRDKHDEMQIRLGRNKPDGTAWAKGDNAKVFKDFYGFADQGGGTVYVLSMAGGAGLDGTDQLATVAHELLHVNAAGDWAGGVGGTIDEGVTETMTKKACAAAGVAPKEAYGSQVAFVAKLAAVVGQNTLESAYFGGVAILSAAFDAVQGEGSWVAFRAAKGDRLERMLTAKHTPDWVKEKIFQINDLLDGWVSDADLDRIAAIWGTLEATEKAQVRSAVQGRVADLTDIGQRTRLRVILGS